MPIERDLDGIASVKVSFLMRLRMSIFTPNGMELLALRHRKKLASKIVYRLLMTGAGYWLYSKPGVLTFLLATAGSKTVLSEGVACAIFLHYFLLIAQKLGFRLNVT